MRARWAGWRPGQPDRSASDRLANPLDQLALGQRADLLGRDLTVLEDDQGRDAAHAVLGGRARVLVDIDLGDGDLAGELLGDLFERRRDHLAGAAPFRPEIYQDR